MSKLIQYGAVLLACFFLPLSARAEQAYPTQDLLSTQVTVTGEEIRYPTSGPARVTVSIVTILPGTIAKIHRHPVPLVGYVLEGELTVDYGNQGKKTFRKGDALVEALNVPHRGMNLGQDIVRILAIYLGADGIPNVLLEETPQP